MDREPHEQNPLAVKSDFVKGIVRKVPRNDWIIIKVNGDIYGTDQ